MLSSPTGFNQLKLCTSDLDIISTIMGLNENGPSHKSLIQNLKCKVFLRPEKKNPTIA